MKNFYKVSVPFVFIFCFTAIRLNSQNVGIGTTSPQSKLDVAGEVRAEKLSIISSTNQNLISASGPSGAILDQQQSQSNSAINNSLPGWQSFTAGTGGTISQVDLNIVSVITTTMIIYSGEGTSGTGLDTATFTSVNGWNTISGLSAPVTAGQKYTIKLSNVAFWTFMSPAPYAEGTSSINNIPQPNNDFAFKTYVTANNKFVVTGQGHVGIGTLSPSASLDVIGKIKSAQLQLTNGAANGYVLTSDANGLGAWVPNNSTSSWTVNGNHISNLNTGNVGIGTSNPSYKLHLGGTTSNLRIDGGTNFSTYFSLGGNGTFSIDAPNIVHGRFVVEDGGNVGIGVVDPVVKLEVAGDMKLTGKMLLENSINVSFQNGWSNPININGGPVQYYKDKMGHVHLKGLAEHPSGTNSTIIFNLPSGYRPSHIMYLNVAGNLNNGWVRVEIRTNGDVAVVGSNVTWVCLDTIQFRVE